MCPWIYRGVRAPTLENPHPMRKHEFTNLQNNSLLPYKPVIHISKALHNTLQYRINHKLIVNQDSIGHHENHNKTQFYSFLKSFFCKNSLADRNISFVLSCKNFSMPIF